MYSHALTIKICIDQQSTGGYCQIFIHNIISVKLFSSIGSIITSYNLPEAK